MPAVLPNRYAVCYVMDSATHEALSGWAVRNIHPTCKFEDGRPLHALGLNSLAHVTLVQIEHADEIAFDAEAWAHAVGAALPPTMPMDYEHYYVNRNASGEEWTGLSIAHDVALWLAAEKAAQITRDMAPEGVSIRNKIGGVYFPHITLAVHEGGSFKEAGNFPIPEGLPQRGIGRLAWGRTGAGWWILGPHYL